MNFPKKVEFFDINLQFVVQMGRQLANMFVMSQSPVGLVGNPHCLVV